MSDRTAGTTEPAARTRERTLSVTTLAAEFHAPSLTDFFPPAVLFEGTPFELDRLMLIRILMSAVLIGLMVLAFRSPRIVPRGLQNVAEIGLVFVKEQICEEVLGKETGRKYFPLIATIFFTVLFLNFSSIVPFLNISSNARIGMPLVLAVIAYIAFNYVGIKKYGFFKYMRSSIVVPNVPPALHVLLIPIEFVSTFILRPFTLTVRLMANMLAGHIMLVLFFSSTWFFLFDATNWMKVFSPFSLLAGIGFTMFEMLVIFLQAYVFALLTAVYIGLAEHADSH
ncbi:F0F1 ATP synthase subunit A [Nocardia cyriacigeorgica]|jgi:F-type H+-transporting ATPase subunit a|uniref:F0F1 ATP synthase subunit A n=1 Tax=Nocardia cyriacigeorgica TaxID=135487 RepID=UPI0009DA9906|nr:F0F1 ATP synthase subunit A [Nocardia cyriacigeorgica]AVH20471.1 ATP synthase F0 subunit A [Nocardia cyriacigeorgica]MBF6090305.1 F0F1 ATP synthase subunit A [Nocardia cyriacigeorgica]MBF6096145.1 F0F1 ATP synthase subunit A [Nocardia cyriacigeorgica]MBF6101430.1 F0F1 ATP synthase subunit A [Nocardia cyriacigeorgica]MBF6162329.1 F0F1 ATP synthase subunit A [Nocardia cyriacigeorgica]